MTQHSDSVSARPKDAILDIQGTITKAPLSRKMIIMPIVVAILLIIGHFLPLDSYGENTGIGLCFFISAVLCHIVQPWDMVITAIMVPVGGYLLGIWDWSLFQTVSGTSTFVSMFAMTLLAAGAQTTPIGKRIALLFLRQLGSSPVRLTVAFGAITAIISAFVSNTATLIMMSTIANSMLITMNEKPGQSKLGRTLMTLIATASFIGGMALISGAPQGNMLGITLLENATDGQFTVTYSQWAAVGVPATLIILVPMGLLFAYGNNLSKNDSTVMVSKDYYDDLLKEMGPVGGSEIRWIVTTLAMVIALTCGTHGTVTPLIAAIVTMLPVIGTVPMRDVFKLVPMKVLFIMFFVTIIGKLFSVTGLGAFFTAILAPMVSGMSPLVLSITLMAIQVFLVNACPNSATGIFSMIMGIGTPLCIASGYNPSVVLLPVMMSSCFFFVLRLNTTIILNKDYGWWELKDSVVPSLILSILLIILMPVLAHLICPMVGMNIYL